MRRSMEMEQESATAQRGERCRRSGWWCRCLCRGKRASSQCSGLYFGSSILTRPLTSFVVAASFSLRSRTFRITSAILWIALSPRSGAEPWQETPCMSTRISILPR